MKKYIIIFSVILCLCLSINAIKAFAQPKTLTQGIYNARDSNLPIGSPITTKINSPNDDEFLLG